MTLPHLGIQQIAIGGPDKARLRALWVDCFGLALTGNYVSERDNVDEDIAVLGAGIAKCEVDLMQPIDPAKKPAVHEPPLNHVGLWVDDLPRAVEWLDGARRALHARRHPQGRRGLRRHASSTRKGNDAAPIGGEGVLIELVQAPPEVIAAFAALRSSRVTAARRIRSAGWLRAYRLWRNVVECDAEPPSGRGWSATSGSAVRGDGEHAARVRAQPTLARRRNRRHPGAA